MGFDKPLDLREDRHVLVKPTVNRAVGVAAMSIVRRQRHALTPPAAFVPPGPGWSFTVGHLRKAVVPMLLASTVLASNAFAQTSDTHQAAATVAVAPSQPTDATPLRARFIDELTERALVKKNAHALLVELGGASEHGVTLTIHGINGSPNTVGALSDAAIARGELVYAVAYDDNYRRLQATADDFAALFAQALAQLPAGKPLKIHAHCMGARTALVALDRMARAGQLGEHDVQLHLLAPPLLGFGSANAAWLALPLMDTFIANIAPGKDMGTNNAFQRELDAVVLPKNVSIRVTVGDRDTLIGINDAYRERVARLGATLEVAQGVDHMQVLEHVAQAR